MNNSTLIEKKKGEKLINLRQYKSTNVIVNG